MFNIIAVPAFKDNYIWVIHDNHEAVVVDPGESQPVLDFLTQHQLTLTAILCTHRHYDHIGGIEALREVYNVPVHGRSHPDNPHITHSLRDGDQLNLPAFGLSFKILEIPGHLDDHVAFFAPDILFCGDVLFGAGCGRNFEGTLEQLHQSLQRLAQLPNTTRVYCTHEYTEVNLRFALRCEPNNQTIQQRIADTRALRHANRPSLPSNIALEKTTNPFLRCTQPDTIQMLKKRGLTDTSEVGVFKALRKWRNVF
jgi:hydroxyacylglutathione hydrolase